MGAFHSLPSTILPPLPKLLHGAQTQTKMADGQEVSLWARFSHVAPPLTIEVSFHRQMASPIVPATTTGHLHSAAKFLSDVAKWDGTSQGIIRTLTTAFEADDYGDHIKNLKALNITTQSYIDNLDKVDSYPILRQRTRFITIW